MLTYGGSLTGSQASSSRPPLFGNARQKGGTLVKIIVRFFLILVSLFYVEVSVTRPVFHIWYCTRGFLFRLKIVLPPSWSSYCVPGLFIRNTQQLSCRNNTQECERTSYIPRTSGRYILEETTNVFYVQSKARHTFNNSPLEVVIMLEQTLKTNWAVHYVLLEREFLQ